jgi:ubiquinone biosynthesis protein
LPPLRAVPLVELIDELGQSIEQQLDFRRKAENNRRFRACFAHDRHIRIPALVEEYCIDAILVMEYMPDLLRINQLHQQGVDYHTSVVTGLKALYQMIFLDVVFEGIVKSYYADLDFQREALPFLLRVR